MLLQEEFLQEERVPDSIPQPGLQLGALTLHLSALPRAPPLLPIALSSLFKGTERNRVARFQATASWLRAPDS